MATTTSLHIFSFRLLLSPIFCLCFFLTFSATCSRIYPFLSGCNKLPCHSFHLSNDRPMSLPDKVHYFNHLQLFVTSIPLPLLFTHLTFWTGGALFYYNFLTYSSPKYSLNNLCVVITLSVSRLVFDEANKLK